MKKLLKKLEEEGMIQPNYYDKKTKRESRNYACDIARWLVKNHIIMGEHFTLKNEDPQLWHTGWCVRINHQGRRLLKDRLSSIALLESCAVK
jgi:hypothetical protein